jgi:hypothetical protein
LREVFYYLGKLALVDGEQVKAQDYLRQSGYRDFNRPITLITPFSEDVASGHAFSPRRIAEIVPGRVYALSGFEFTEYYLVVSNDRRELIGIDAGTTLALSQMWRPHGGHRETYGCPDPTPFSTLSRRSRRRIRQFRSPSPGASHHLPPWCDLLAPNPATRFQPRLKLSPRPRANYNQTNPACPLASSTTSSRSLSHHPTTIEFA